MAVAAAPGKALRANYGVLVLGLSLAAAIALGARWGADWPAQEFRAWSARISGLTTWTNQWYAGQALPGYSVLYPLAARVAGAGGTGFLAVVGAAWGAERLAPAGSRTRQIGYRCSVALVLDADLLIGQVPYLLAVAFGVWAVWAVRVGRLPAAALLAVACSLASPLAGFFLLLIFPAAATQWGVRRCAPLLGAASGVLVSVLVGGAGGPFPFAPLVLLWTIAFAVLAMVVPRRSARSIRVLGVVYGVAAVLLFLLPNPIGGNLARLGQLCGLPLIWHALPQLRWRRWFPIVPMVAAAALWPVWPAAGSVVKGAADPSQQDVYFSRLNAFLDERDPAHGRLEVVFTREHWESVWVARRFPIARGWERQTDLAANAVLYSALTASTYRRWLDDNAVAFVALPNVPIDYGGQAEAALLAHPPDYLRPVWHDANIRVWRVLGARPLTSRPAQLISFGTASLVLRFSAAGRTTVRVRASSMWSVAGGQACVSADPHGWLTVTARTAGQVTLRARFGVGSILDSQTC